MEFWKGHGTENDFVLLPDADGVLRLTAGRVRALCDRRRGLGADGVLRVVRTARVPGAPAGVAGDGWFMDYRNADGSVAEMCGNGLRVFARYLVDAGLAAEGAFDVGTRAGSRRVTVHPDRSVTVAMGAATVFGRSVAKLPGRELPGVAVDVGNPHLVCLVGEPVADFDLSAPPGYDTLTFPAGVNVELVNVLADGRLRMRVYERGVGETRSCGTGTVAAVAGARELLAGRDSTGARCTVEVPGGAVDVVLDGWGSTLTGPAVLVAHGELDRAWWDALLD